MSYNLRVVQAATLALMLTGCGDDGGGGDEGASTESEGDASSTGAMTTMAMTTADDTTGTTGENSGSSGEDSGSTAADSGSSGGSGDAGSSGTTGDAVDCAPLMMKECEMTEGCLWAGNPNNGECISDDPAQCEGLEQMDCMSNPVCAWDNQGATCNAA